MIAAMASAKHKDVMARLARLARPPAGRPEVQHAGKTSGRPAWREARRSLRQYLEQVWKHDRRIKSLSPRQQHQLRIDCKKLRYLAEFFQDFYGRKFRDMIRTAIELQDQLGTVHDTHVYADWLKDFASRRAKQSGKAIERLLDRLRDQRRDCLDKAARVWKSFRGHRSKKRLLRLIDSPNKKS